METTIGGKTRGVIATAAMAALLVLIGLLGREALLAARSQRQTVEGVLRDYAEIAAERYAGEMFLALDYNWLFPVSRTVRVNEEIDSPDIDDSIETPSGSYAAGVLVRRFFAYEPGADRWVGARGWPPPFENPALRDLVLAEAAVAEREGWPVALLLPEIDLAEGPIVYRASRDLATGALAVVGFEGRPEGFQAVLSRALDANGVLPRALADGSGDELVSVELVSVDGRVLYRSGPPFEPAYSAVAELGPRVRGLRVRAAIPSSSAERLVIGGLPASRLPAIAVMLAGSLILLLGGVWVMRRERELVRMRERFVAGASHELRTPLSQIRMFAETLRLDRVRTPGERDRSLAILDREARRLSYLVENLLHFSRPDRSEGDPPTERVELTDLASEVLESFAPLAAERGTVVVLHADAPVHATAHRDRVRQVLLNLLENASKYGPSGQTVVVSASVAADGRALLRVDDEGPGIPDAWKARIWTRFWRGPNAEHTTGTGIGLALVRELVASCQGEIEVSDRPGGGARFEVSLRRGRSG